MFNLDADVDQLLLKSANIPKRFMPSATCDALKHEGWASAFTQLLEKVRVRNNGFVLVLCGDRGTGKTRLACKLMWECIQDPMLRYFTRYEVFQDYLDAIRDGWNAESNYELHRQPRLLVLDEIAKSGDSAWAESKLFHLVNTRYNEQKHTILITASAPAAVETIIGPSVADRINEGGTVIHLNWPSFRNKTT